MKTFAALAVLAASAAAVDLQNKIPLITGEEQVEVVVVEDKTSYVEEIEVLPDAEIAVAMVQGTGRDHTDWSWHWENMEAKKEADKADEDVITAEGGLIGAIGEYEVVLGDILSPQVEHQRNCQLHREEEINLYYQCTQTDINNYALHHFGGDARSYPRWVEEYNVCIDHIHSAKTLHLDYYWPDGLVTLEPCDPQDHSSSVYIGMDMHVGLPFNGEVTIITANPLQPHKSCMGQNIPNWGGLWVELKNSSPNEAQDVLMGNIKLEKAGYAMRCYDIRGTTDPSMGHMHETWDEEGERDYDVTLRKDPRQVEDSCMIHTALHGTGFTQWISGVGQYSMNMQIQEEWHITQADGSEQFDQTHNELRIGACTQSADGHITATKHLIPGVRLF